MKFFLQYRKEKKKGVIDRVVGSLNHASLLSYSQCQHYIENNGGEAGRLLRELWYLKLLIHSQFF